jgi:porphobilinogen deaminase
MTRRRKLSIGLAAAAVLAVAAFVAWPKPVYDYMADNTGEVVDATGAPVPGVRVTYRSAQVVYEAITPLRSAQTITDERGRFAFFFISCGTPAGRYRLTFQKEGLATVAATGKGSGKHRIVMRSLRVQSSG